jgi:hypothetical protein
VKQFELDLNGLNVIADTAVPDCLGRPQDSEHCRTCDFYINCLADENASKRQREAGMKEG